MGRDVWGGGVHVHELRCRKQGPHDADAALRGRDPQHETLLRTLVCPVGILYEARHRLQKTPTPSGFPEETMARRAGLCRVSSFLLEAYAWPGSDFVLITLFPAQRQAENAPGLVTLVLVPLHNSVFNWLVSRPPSMLLITDTSRLADTDVAYQPVTHLDDRQVAGQGELERRSCFPGSGPFHAAYLPWVSPTPRVLCLGSSWVCRALFHLLRLCPVQDCYE